MTIVDQEMFKWQKNILSRSECDSRENLYYASFIKFSLSYSCILFVTKIHTNSHMIFEYRRHFLCQLKQNKFFNFFRFYAWINFIYYYQSFLFTFCCILSSFEHNNFCTNCITHWPIEFKSKCTKNICKLWETMNKYL